MGADQIAQLRPPIRKVFAAGPRSNSANWCATFEVDGRPYVWAQVTFDEVNVVYPLAGEPTEELARHEQLPVTAVKLTDWEPSKFATFSHSGNADDVAIFIDAYLARVCLSGYENYALNVTLQNLS
jgi:hypothetical protein